MTQFYITCYISHYSDELISPTGSRTARVEHSVLVTALTRNVDYPVFACAHLINLAILRPQSKKHKTP